MTLHAVEPRTERRHDVNHRRHEPRQTRVISGETFRRDVLGWSKGTFYAWVKSGRFTHLRATHLCTARRTFYVRADVEQWVAQTPGLTLRARHQQRG